MKKFLSTIFLFIMFLTLNAQNITYIDLTQAKFGEIPANRVFEEIKYVPLETHTDALLNIRGATYYLTDKYIIAMNFTKEAYLFDRETGKFIREVSSYGQGPDEYSSPLHNFYGFDEKNNILFSGGTYDKLWKCINILTNKVESTIKKPVPENDNEICLPVAPWFIKDNIYISFCNNRTGKDKVRLIVYDKNGTTIKKYPQYLEYNKGNENTFPANNGIFFYYNGLTYFKERNYNDTVFCVDENRMLPHIIFKLGNKQPSYYHQDNADYNKGKYLINFVSESKSFILFSFTYFTETTKISGQTVGTISSTTTLTGYYDKKSKQAYISSTPDLKKSGYIANGIPMSFYPVSINKSKEMITKIDPEELMKYKDGIDPKYKRLFQDIQEDDNPIIIIAKLK